MNLSGSREWNIFDSPGFLAEKENQAVNKKTGGKKILSSKELRYIPSK